MGRHRRQRIRLLLNALDRQVVDVLSGFDLHIPVSELALVFWDMEVISGLDHVATDGVLGFCLVLLYDFIHNVLMVSR